MRRFMCRAVTLQTVVIVDGLEVLDAATKAAAAARPDDDLIYTVYGLTACSEVTDDQGELRHVHWFSDDVSVMKPGIVNRMKAGRFGGYLYATRTPDAPHVRHHCDSMAALCDGARPVMLVL